VIFAFSKNLTHENRKHAELATKHGPSSIAKEMWPLN